MLADVLGKAGAADEMNVEPSGLPASADEAADRARAEDSDAQGLASPSIGRDALVREP